MTEGVDATPWSAAFTLPGDGRLSHTRIASNANPLQEEVYTYDAIGRLVALSSRGYSEYSLDYQYDAANRLLARTPGDGMPLSYAYDYDQDDR